MAELGIASGVAGLLTLGLTICKGILKVYEPFRDAYSDIDNTYQSIESLYKILASLDPLLRNTTLSAPVYEAVETSLASCHGSFAYLRKKLEKINLQRHDGTLAGKLKSSKGRTIYAFKESTLAKVREGCAEARDNLDLALQSLQLDLSQILSQRLEHLQLQNQQAINDLRTSMHNIVEKSEEDAYRRTFEWLSPLGDTFQKKQRETFDTQVRQDAGAKALLETKEFREWIGGCGKTLWCTGLPGIGKTITISFIVNHLLKYRSDNVGVAYMYFSYKDSDKQTAVNLFASLLQQLVSQRPACMSDVTELCEQHLLNNTRPSAGDLCQLLRSVVDKFEKTYILIDALDECSDIYDLRVFLLMELAKLKYKTCLLIMSRPILDLGKALHDATKIHIEASDTDIRNYLLERLTTAEKMKRHLRQDPGLGNTIVNRILHRIRGMFLMARLYLDTLVSRVTRRSITAALERLPDGIDKIYDELMTRIEVQNSPEERDYAMKIIAWVFFAAKPLTVDQVQQALAIEDGDSDLVEAGIIDRDLVVSVCAGLIIINDKSNTISLVHYTAQEYFERNGKRRIEHLEPEIARTCIFYLSFDCFQNWENYIMEHPEAIQEVIETHPLLGYAAQHWGDHVRHISDEVTEALAIKLLQQQSRVHLIVQAKDFAEHLTKGTFFNTRTQVTGLSLASSFGMADVAARLLDRGADLEACDSNGQSALLYAVSSGQYGAASTLVDRGSDVDHKDHSGWSSLHIACSKRYDDLVKLLLAKNAYINAIDGYRATPLYRAAEVGSESITRALLSAGADVSTPNSYSATALHRAADAGHFEIVEMLIANGADLFAKDHYGYTPFYRAADQGHEDVARLLRECMDKQLSSKKDSSYNGPGRR